MARGGVAATRWRCARLLLLVIGRSYGAEYGGPRSRDSAFACREPTLGSDAISGGLGDRADRLRLQALRQTLCATLSTANYATVSTWNPGQERAGPLVQSGPRPYLRSALILILIVKTSTLRSRSLRWCIIVLSCLRRRRVHFRRRRCF